MIHTDEDDEFERIMREQEMRKGQPYLWAAEATKAAVLIEREECARIADSMDACQDGAIGEAIRARGQA
jgi:hypothetical protein